MGKKRYSRDFEDFLDSNRVIGVSYQPGFRGGIIERIISLSPEVRKPLEMDIAQRGDVAGSMTALGFRMPNDLDSGWYFWEVEQRLERGDPEWNFPDERASIIDEISTLYGFDGRPIWEGVEDGGMISFISHWDINRLRQIWPNARYVIPHWFGGYRWFRDVYSKVHSRPLHKAEMDDMLEIAKAHDLDVSGIMTIIQYHAWKWSGFRSFDDGTVRDFMRREVGRIRAKQSLNRTQRGIHTVDLHRLFHGPEWRYEYADLCLFCGITPEFQLCESMIEDYNSKQWVR